MLNKRLAVLMTGLLAISAVSIPTAPTAQEIAGPYLAAEHAARRGDIAEASRLFARVLARDPNNLRLMEQTMLHQVAAGKIAQAVVVARKLERLQPGHHLGVLILAADGLKSERYSNVTDLLGKEEGDGDGGPFVGRIMEAWGAFGDGDVETSKSILSDLEKSGNGGLIGQILAAYHIGLVEAAAGNDAEAAVALKRAGDASRNGGTNRLIRTRAVALARSGDLETAKQIVQDRLDQTLGAPRLEELAADLAEGGDLDLLTEKPEQGAAEALFAISGYVSRGTNRLIGLAYARLSAYLDPELIEAQLLIAEILAEDEQHNLAIEAFARIPEDAPEAMDAQIGRARALRDAEELDEGLSVLREVVARYGDAIEAHTALGDMLRQASRFEEAATAYDGAVALIDEPENRHWVLYYQRGIAYERSKQWEKAEPDFRRALELEPDQPLVLNYLGYSWVEMGENLGEAQEMIEKAVAQRPDDGYIVDSLGWVLYRLGKFQESLKHMARAVELRPVDPVINDHYGDVLWINGRKLEAEFQWRRALSFDPEEDEEKRIKRKLAIGLDIVLEEEAADGNPALIGKAADERDGDGG